MLQTHRCNLGTPTPQIVDASDIESTGRQSDISASPQSAEGGERSHDRAVQEADEDEEGNGPATSAHDSDIGSQPPTPARGQSSIPVKRRAGRPPRTRARVPTTHDDTESRDAASDVGTPRRRGGWRGRGFGGGRWGKARGGPSHVTQVPLDKEGNMATVKDDEIELPDDPEGETKVDKNGTLLGGREYKVRVFTISGKGDRLYMLSTEPARCIGFRDSYLFFQKHKTLWKIILTEEAKRDLIERSLIPHSYKGRAIGVVTARSVFREFGAKIIIGGRKVVDDYQAAAARARGDVQGELAVPGDKLPGEGDAYDKNRFVAWHGASSVYHTGGPSIPLPSGKIIEGKKRKVIVTGSNWMLEHAREASRFNTSVALTRRRNLEGVYDPHTNVLQYPRIMQPTHARWEACGANYDSPYRELTDGDKEANTKFFQIPSVLERNFLIADTYFTSPPLMSFGIPGPDGDVLDVGPPGLPAISESVAASMPFDSRRALQSAQQEASKWKTSWKGESADGARAQLRISYNQ
ncbi:MAG: hypothetical protein LQ343_001708 [Gyalolechia ehrenbergii]|nr:MAG: hypothetical protein LQ343_001708 [Gyalolechia ehrenbergii]